MEDEQRDAAADDAEPRPVLLHGPAEAATAGAGPAAPPPPLAPHDDQLHPCLQRSRREAKKCLDAPRRGHLGSGCRIGAPPQPSSAGRGRERPRQTDERPGAGSAGCLDPSYTAAGRKARLGRWRSAFTPAVLIYYYSWAARTVTAD